MTDTNPTHCGHDPAQFVTADEGTSYCPACENKAAGSALGVAHTDQEKT